MKMYRAPWEDPGYARLMCEDEWFQFYQGLLLRMANTDFGRELLNIPKEYPPIVFMRKNCVRSLIGLRPDGRTIFASDYRVGAKWANVIRSRFSQFQSYARHFMDDPADVPMSRLLSFARSVHATTSTFYPDPNPETTTVDGCAREYTEASNTWAQIHSGDGDDTPAADDSATVYCEGSAPSASNDFRITRAFILFDTSSILDDDVIQSANVQLWRVGMDDQSNDAYGYVTIIGLTTPTSSTAIAAGDYDQCGAETNPTKMSDDLDMTGTTGGAYNTFTMNATGLANISKTGVTKWGFREGHDIENVAPAGSKANEWDASAADTAGTSQDPKLTVTHVGITRGPGGGAAYARPFMY